jgi:hypothetical protein
MVGLGETLGSPWASLAIRLCKTSKVRCRSYSKLTIPLIGRPIYFGQEAIPVLTYWAQRFGGGTNPQMYFITFYRPQHFRPHSGPQITTVDHGN